MGEDPNTDAETNGPIRVLLADDHTTRSGRALPGYWPPTGMEVIAEVPNDGRALQLARELSPDVVIMEVQMPFSLGPRSSSRRCAPSPKRPRS